MAKTPLPKIRLDPAVMENLVVATMFMYWITAQDEEEQRTNDCSFREAITAAQRELNRYGSRLPTLDQFIDQVDDTVRQGAQAFLLKLKHARSS